MEKMKCPLCNDIMNKGDMKNCDFCDFPPIETNSSIKLVLRVRKTYNMSVFKPSMDVAPENERVLVISRETFVKSNQEKLKECETFLKECLSSQEFDMVPFISEAIEILGDRSKNFLKKTDFGLSGLASKSTSVSEKDTQYFEFYQNPEGNYVFLHPLCIKFMLEEYGERSKLPKEIEGEITETCGFFVTQGQKKKYRFLEHLPENSEVIFVIINMEKLLSGVVLEDYESELRVLKRQQNEKKEKHHQKYEEYRKISDLRLQKKKESDQIQSIFDPQLPILKPPR